MNESLPSKIAFISDAHLGKKSQWKLDNSMVSLRTNDAINRFYWILDSISKRGDVKLIVCAGDLFDSDNIEDTIVKKVISIIKLLKNNGVGIIIIGGNHDSTSNIFIKQKIDYLNSDIIPNCLVFRSFTTLNFTARENVIDNFGLDVSTKMNNWWKKNVIPELGSKGVGISLLPFLSMESIKMYYQLPYIEKKAGQKYDKKITREQLEAFLSKIFIPDMAKKLNNCRHKILVGHYQLSGSAMHTDSNPEDLKRELNWTKDMINENLWDIVTFGHIHLPQSVWGEDGDKLYKTQHIGSLDRIRFDERDEHRRYLLYNLESKEFTEVSLDPNPTDVNRPQVRPMFQIEIEIPLGDSNPEKTVLEEILKKVDRNQMKSCLLKIIINIRQEDRSKCNVEVLRRQIEDLVFFVDKIMIKIIKIDKTDDHVNVSKRYETDSHILLSQYLEGVKQDLGEYFGEATIIYQDILSEAEKIRKENILE